jgi:competence protein ComEC
MVVFKLMITCSPIAISVVIITPAVMMDPGDHTGGAAAVQRLSGAGQTWRGGPAEGFDACHGRRWRWDRVDFHLLDPPRPAGASDNDTSCVLLVDDGRHATLIAGDISARVEAPVLRRVADRAPLALVFAPHHGSNSSSSRALVRVLTPRIVFVSAARGNRFGHPHPAVTQRYRAVGSVLHQTGRHGALIWSSANPNRVVRWREYRAPYWRAALPAAAPSNR